MNPVHTGCVQGEKGKERGIDTRSPGSIIRPCETYGSRLTCRGSWPPDPHSVTNLFFFSHEPFFANGLIRHALWRMLKMSFLCEWTALTLVCNLTVVKTAPSRLCDGGMIRIGTDPRLPAGRRQTAPCTHPVCTGYIRPQDGRVTYGTR